MHAGNITSQNPSGANSTIPSKTVNLYLQTSRLPPTTCSYQSKSTMNLARNANASSTSKGNQRTLSRSFSKNISLASFSLGFTVASLLSFSINTNKIVFKPSQQLFLYSSATVEKSNVDITEESNNFGNQPLKLAICIVGQTQRLELPSKAENIVQANLGEKVESFVFGVLDRGIPQYTNSNIGNVNSCYTSPHHEVDVPKVFKSIFEHSGAKHVELVLQDPMSFNVTEHAMKTVFVNYRSKHEREKRVQNHHRMYMHDKQCAMQIFEYERKTGSIMDVIVRIRDGALVHGPLRIKAFPTDMFRCMMKKTINGACVLSKKCNSWSGYSDKFWVIPRSLLASTMVKPIEDWLSVSRYLQEAQVYNSEGMLKQIWDHHFNGGYRKATNESVLPVTDTRCMSPGVLPTLEGKTAIFEPVDRSKDCQPVGDLYDPAKSTFMTVSNSYSKSQEVATEVYRVIGDPAGSKVQFADATPGVKDGYEASYGFYYPGPWNGKGSAHLAMIRKRKGKLPELGDSIEVVIYNKNKSNGLKFSKPHSVCKTSAFNVPLGARQQWVGRSNNIIYNYRKEKIDRNGPFGSRLVSSEGVVLLELDFPIFSLNTAGTRAVTLDFARVLAFSHEGVYGYSVPEDIRSRKVEKKITKTGGIWGASISPNATKMNDTKLNLIITPMDVVTYMIKRKRKIYTDRRLAGKWLKDCFVWLEQPRLNDFGDRLLFMARAKCPADLDLEEPLTVRQLQQARYINIGIFTIGFDGEHLWYADGFPVSHFDFIGGGEGELLLCGNEGMFVTTDLVGGGTKWSSGQFAPNGADLYAGHCSISRADRRLILTDTSCTACTVECDGSLWTCPKGQSGRVVGILNKETKILKPFGHFASNVTIPEPLWVDLHPRFSPDGKMVMIDSAHDFEKGSRAYVADISDIT